MALGKDIDSAGLQNITFSVDKIIFNFLNICVHSDYPNLKSLKQMDQKNVWCTHHMISKLNVYICPKVLDFCSMLSKRYI